MHSQDGGHVLEDPLTGSFFSLGAVEYRFLQLLDGTRSVAEVVGRLSVEAGADALSEQTAVSLVRVLAESHLLEGGGTGHVERVREEVNRKQDGSQLLQHGKSLLFWRIPLGNPDRFLDRVAPWLGWLVSFKFFLVWCVVIIAGAVSVGRNWSRFRDETAGMFEVGNLFILAAIWVVLKVFHEGWHALVCKHFGGSVPEVGVMMLMFVTPLGYVNASSATRFASKWKRIFVSAAGIYGEFFVAGLAAIIWAQLDPGLLSRGLHEAIVISSVTTLLFNANPLMRFDGYYILADLCGVRNLYPKAQRSASFWFRRWFLGADPSRHPLPDRDRRTWITLYGIAAFFWRILVLVGILSLISHRWSGAGLMIAVVVAIATVVSIYQGSQKYFRQCARSEGVSRLRFATRLTLGLVVLAALLAFVRITPSVRVPAVVAWLSDGEVRVECPGFLEQLVVKNGDQVRAGDTLATIRNPDEEARLNQLRLDLRRTQILANQYLQSEEIAAYQAEQRQIAALEVKLQEVEHYLGTLVLKAVCDGVVYGHNFANLEGTYVEKGQLICTVGRSDAKRLIMAVSLENADLVQGREGSSVMFQARGRIGRMPADLSRVNPHASTRIPHFGLIAPAGGPLVARRIFASSQDEEHAETRIHADVLSRQFELSAPYFEANAELEKSASLRVEPGEIGYVRVFAEDQRTLWDLVSDWAERAIRRAGQQAA